MGPPWVRLFPNYLLVQDLVTTDNGDNNILHKLLLDTN